MSDIHFFNWILKQVKNETCYFHNITIFDSISCSRPLMPSWVSQMNHQNKLYVISQMDLLYYWMPSWPMPSAKQSGIISCLTSSHVTVYLFSHHTLGLPFSYRLGDFDHHIIYGYYLWKTSIGNRSHLAVSIFIPNSTIPYILAKQNILISTTFALCARYFLMIKHSTA